MLNDSKVMTSKFLASTAWATYFVAGLGHLGGLSNIKSGGGEGSARSQHEWLGLWEEDGNMLSEDSFGRRLTKAS